jgi:hypothetical protein
MLDMLQQHQLDWSNSLHINNLSIYQIDVYKIFDLFSKVSSNNHHNSSFLLGHNLVILLILTFDFKYLLQFH